MSGSYDNTIKIWDAQTGNNIKLILDHINPINSLRYSSDGKKIVSSSNDKTIKLWNA